MNLSGGKRDIHGHLAPLQQPAYTCRVDRLGQERRKSPVRPVRVAVAIVVCAGGERHYVHRLPRAGVLEDANAARRLEAVKHWHFDVLRAKRQGEPMCQRAAMLTPPHDEALQSVHQSHEQRLKRAIPCARAP